MEVTEQDTFLASFPKSGTTWLLHLVHNINYRADPPADRIVDDFIPWLDCDPYTIKPPGEDRYFKSHVPFSWLPFHPKAKYIYVVRNSKDVAVSFYYFLEGLLRRFIPSINEIKIEDYIDLFVDGKVLYGSWWSHVMEWYDASLKHDNVLLLTYEELSSCLQLQIERIAKFLGKPLTVGEAEIIATKCKFQQMKADSSSSMGYVKNFMRKGVCGDHVNYFTKEQIARYNEKDEGILPKELLARMKY